MRPATSDRGSLVLRSNSILCVLRVVVLLAVQTMEVILLMTARMSMHWDPTQCEQRPP